jgi:tryptophan synthase alpha chain
MIQFESNPGLVVYLTCGDPSLDVTREIALAAIDVGADVIELGVPFSDPVADGPVIQRASERALQKGTSLRDVLALAAELREARPQAGLIIFSYFNPILRMGVREFAQASAKAGVDGALLTDLTLEESDEYVRMMRAHKLHTVFLAAPTSSDQRLKRIAKASSGFVYAVSRTGVTGAQQQIAADAAQLVKRLRRFTKLPVAIGFGISSAEQFRVAGKFADAAVVGSAIVQLIERNPPETAAQAVAEFVRGLRQATAARA